MSLQRVAVVAGARTPFVKSDGAFAPLGPLSMATHVVRGVLSRAGIDPAAIDTLVAGVVLPEPGMPNLAREVVFAADLPRRVEGHTVTSYCISGLRAVSAVAEAIATGRAGAGIAVGTEWLSGRDANTFREPTTRLTMGEHMELVCRDWPLPRERQDELALASHRKACASRGLLTGEILPLAGVEHDTCPRPDTSLDALAALPPAFDPQGSVTAGNASPITDGAAAVVLMSEERARAEGLEPLAFVGAIEYGAIDPADGLLMAPAVVVPRLLGRTGRRLADFDRIEIHEAFAAQVMANAMALEQGWRGAPTGDVDWQRVNVHGSSIALGHPWSATGARIVSGLAAELKRSAARRGLISVCAAGAMAGAMILEGA